jgi:hypothetical protein
VNRPQRRAFDSGSWWLAALTGEACHDCGGSFSRKKIVFLFDLNRETFLAAKGYSFLLSENMILKLHLWHRLLPEVFIAKKLIKNDQLNISRVPIRTTYITYSMTCLMSFFLAQVLCLRICDLRDKINKRRCFESTAV